VGAVIMLYLTTKKHDEHLAREQARAMATIYLLNSIGHSKERTILLNQMDCAWRNPESPVKCSDQRFLKLPESKAGCTGIAPPLRTTGIRYDLSPLARIFSLNSPFSAWCSYLYKIKVLLITSSTSTPMIIHLVGPVVATRARFAEQEIRGNVAIG
jgi:hypothetical protein